METNPVTTDRPRRNPFNINFPTFEDIQQKATRTVARGYAQAKHLERALKRFCGDCRRVLLGRVPEGETVDLGDVRVTHYTVDQVESDAWAQAAKQDPEIKQIEETYQRAKAVRDDARAGFAVVDSRIRITEETK